MPPSMTPYPTPPSFSESLFAPTPEVVIFSIDEDLSTPTSSQSSTDSAPSRKRASHPRYQTATTSTSAPSSSASSISTSTSSRSRRAVRFAVPADADKKRRRLASPEPARKRISLPMAHVMDSLESLSVCEVEDGGMRYPSPSSSVTASNGSCDSGVSGDGDGGGRRMALDEMSERHARRWARRAAPY